MDSASYRRKLVARHGGAALAAVGAETLVGFPLETLKVKLQVAPNSGQLLSNYQGFAQMAPNSGLSGIYRGAIFQLLGRPPALAARYGVYRLASAFHQDGRDELSLDVPAAFFAGALAGAAESVICAPFEVLKNRIQAETAFVPLSPASSPFAIASTSTNPSAAFTSLGSSNKLYPGRGWSCYPWMPAGARPANSAIEAVQVMRNLEGLRMLWTGWRPTLLRDSVYGGVFFSGWLTLHQLAKEVEALQSGKDIRYVDRRNDDGPVASTLEAGVAAAVAAIASYPLDMAATRRHTTVTPKHVRLERTMLKIVEKGSLGQQVSALLPGGGVYWRALALRSFQHFVATAALVGTYHFALSLR